MKLAVNPNPYIRSHRSTTKIMMELLIGLIIIWISGIVYYFVRGNVNEGLHAIFNVVISCVSCCFLEILFFIPKWKKEEGHNFLTLLKKELYSFGYITGIIMALLMPVGIEWWQIVISSIFAIVICKMLFGGFSYNIFNPAVVGRLIAGVCFSSSFKYGLSYNGNPSINVGSTVLSTWANSSWDISTLYNINGVDLYSNSWHILLGDYAGALGETFTITILIVGIILMIRNVIDYRISLSYLLVCFLSSLIVGLQSSSPLLFALLQVSTGGIMFGAIFCLTDPVTSPTSPFGKIVFGAGAGFLTMLVRFKGSSAEGVALSIIFMNMLTPLIDMLLKGRTIDNFKKKAIIVSIILVAMLLIPFTYKIQNNGVNGELISYELLNGVMLK